MCQAPNIERQLLKLKFISITVIYIYLYNYLSLIIYSKA